LTGIRQEILGQDRCLCNTYKPKKL